MERCSNFIVYRCCCSDVRYFIGVVYGAISGFFGGRVDMIMQRILEVIASIPNLIVVILFVLILNHPFGQLYWLCLSQAG